MKTLWNLTDWTWPTYDDMENHLSTLTDAELDAELDSLPSGYLPNPDGSLRAHLSFREDEARINALSSLTRERGDRLALRTQKKKLMVAIICTAFAVLVLVIGALFSQVVGLVGVGLVVGAAVMFHRVGDARSKIKSRKKNEKYHYGVNREHAIRPITDEDREKVREMLGIRRPTRPSPEEIYNTPTLADPFSRIIHSNFVAEREDPESVFSPHTSDLLDAQPYDGSDSS